MVLQPQGRLIGQISVVKNMQQMTVYIMTKHDAKNSPDMMTYKVHTSNKLAHILINPGATFSFISSTFVMYNRLKSYDRKVPIVVNIPIDTSVICETIIKDVSVKIGKDKMK